MKQYITFISILILLSTMLTGCNWTHWDLIGAEQYYVQMKTDTIEETQGATCKGQSCDYILPGFDEKGNEKTMKFNAGKLRTGAFLRIYYRDKGGVKSFEEVKKAEIPTKAKEKLGVE